MVEDYLQWNKSSKDLDDGLQTLEDYVSFVSSLSGACENSIDCHGNIKGARTIVGALNTFSWTRALNAIQILSFYWRSNWRRKCFTSICIGLEDKMKSHLMIIRSWPDNKTTLKVPHQTFLLSEPLYKSCLNEDQRWLQHSALPTIVMLLPK